MKILMTFGAVPHYVDSLLKVLTKRGLELVVVVPQKTSAIIGAGVKTVAKTDGYKRIESPETKALWGKQLFCDLPKIVHEERPNIVVLGWPYFLQIALQPSLCKAIRCVNAKIMIREIPFQVPPFGKIRKFFREKPMYDESMNLKSSGLAFYLRQFVISLIRRRCYALADGTLNYSTAAYDILPSYSVDSERINVTYNSSDTVALECEREAVLVAAPLLPACDARVLHIGRLVKWKRVDLLIDAISILYRSNPTVELAIIGDGPELENLKQQAIASPAADRIRFLGAVYDPIQLGGYMQVSSVYALAGMGGLSINDAMTYGLPVVCSVCDSTEVDLVTPRNGSFFRQGDANDLAQKLENILQNPTLRQEMGEQSRKIILEKINLNYVADNYLTAFRKVLHDKGEERVSVFTK